MFSFYDPIAPLSYSIQKEKNNNYVCICIIDMHLPTCFLFLMSDPKDINYFHTWKAYIWQTVGGFMPCLDKHFNLIIT